MSDPIAEWELVAEGRTYPKQRLAHKLADALEDAARERDELAVAFNAAMSKIGEALGYPTNFDADPIELVDQLIDARLQTSMHSEPVPRHAMYAVIVRGRFRYLVKLGSDARAQFHTDFDTFGSPLEARTFTLTGTITEMRMLRDFEEPGSRAHLSKPTRSILRLTEKALAAENGDDQ